MKVQIYETGEIKEITSNHPNWDEGFLVESECMGGAWGQDLFAPTYAPEGLYPDTADVDPNICMDAMDKYGVRMHQQYYDHLSKLYAGWVEAGCPDDYDWPTD